MECERHLGQGTVILSGIERCYGCYLEQFDYCPLCGYKWDDPRECGKGDQAVEKPPIILAHLWMQRDADLKWFVKWGDEVCIGHGSYQYSLYRRQCSQCWQDFKYMLKDKK